MSDTPEFISMAPHPRLVQASIEHCKLRTIEFTDEGEVILPGQGFNSNGNMSFPDGERGEAMTAFLSDVLTLAMLKHMEDTMILPSNVSRIRETCSTLQQTMDALPPGDAYSDIEDAIDTLMRVADNLDPKNR